MRAVRRAGRAMPGSARAGRGVEEPDQRRMIEIAVAPVDQLLEERAVQLQRRQVEAEGSRQLVHLPKVLELGQGLVAGTAIALDHLRAVQFSNTAPGEAAFQLLAPPGALRLRGPVARPLLGAVMSEDRRRRTSRASTSHTRTAHHT